MPFKPSNETTGRKVEGHCRKSGDIDAPLSGTDFLVQEATVASQQFCDPTIGFSFRSRHALWVRKMSILCFSHREGRFVQKILCGIRVIGIKEQ